MLPPGRSEQNAGLGRVRFQLRATGVPLEPPNPLRSGVHTRGYLPHVKREGASYFVTFRLADSLPQDVLRKFQAERAERLRQFHAQKAPAEKGGQPTSPGIDLEAIDRDYYRKLERFLDTGSGKCWLRRPEIADGVADALRFFAGQRYRLDAWVVMPNHVHAVLWPMPNHALSDILQSWKRFTAREANKRLARTGEPFWQRESFDHWIRSDEEHARCCRYVANNPVKAGLCSAPEEWRWSSAWQAQA